MSRPPFLQIHDLTVHREQRMILEGLELKVPAGSFLTVEGVSGVGKSSLLACLAGLLEPVSGEIRYRRNSGSEHRPASFRTHMGCVFQNLLLVPNATAETNVLCGLLAQRPSWRTLLGFPRTDRLRACALLARLGMGNLAGKPVAKLSGGERQRVAVARALIARPECLLADEPVSNLNPELGRITLALLKEECHVKGCLVICALHDEVLAREFADWRLQLRGGRDWELTAGGPL
jgi:phosphonate transport system ATP-binding protein